MLGLLVVVNWQPVMLQLELPRLLSPYCCVRAHSFSFKQFPLTLHEPLVHLSGQRKLN